MSMKNFVDLSKTQQQATRLYWLLVVAGPLTMPEIRQQTNWTTARVNNTLRRLRMAGDVRRLPGKTYERQRGGSWANWCGKYQAVEGCAEKGAISA